jgi:hypothetical protein
VASVKVERRLGRGVNGAEDRSVGIGRIRVPRQRANATRNVDDAGSRRLAQQRQHRLVYGEHAEYVGLPHCTHFIKGHVTRTGPLGVLRDGLATGPFARIRDGRVVDEQVQAAELCRTAHVQRTRTHARGGAGRAYILEDHAATHIAQGRLVRLLEYWTPAFPGYFLYY